MEVLAPKPKTKEHKVDSNTTVIETESGHCFKITEGAPPRGRKLYDFDNPMGGEMPTQLLEQVNSGDLLNRRTLKEAATTSEFPSQLREDFKVIMLSAFESAPDVIFPLAFQVQSTKEKETYAGIEKMKKTDGIVREGSPYFVLGTDPKTDVEIYNRKRGGIVEITEEMILYDKSGQITRLAAELGDSIKYERYQLLVDVLEDTNNTTAAAATVTLTPTNLETMLTAYMKQSDTASSKILNWSADTLIVPAALQWTARRILESAGAAGTANNDINVLKGIVNLVVCPLMDANSTTAFYLGRARNPNGLIYQNVIGPQPETFTQQATKNQTSDDVFYFDFVRYKARLCYGQDVIDTRIWHRSTT